MKSERAWRTLRRIVDGRHNRRHVETALKRPDSIRDDRNGRVSEGDGPKSCDEEEAAEGEPDGAHSSTRIDMSTEQHAADRTDEGGHRKRTAISEEALAQRNEETDLPGEKITRHNPAIRHEDEHACTRRAKRTRRLTRNPHVGRKQDRHRGGG